MVSRITAAFLVTCMLVGGGAMALAYGLRDGALLAGLLMLMGLPVLAVSYLIAMYRRRLGRLTWQFVVGVVVVLSLDLVGIQLVATQWLSPRETLALALMMLFACLLVGITAWCLIRDITRDIAEVRDGVAAMREGSREPEVELAGEGADELSALATEFNRLTRELRQMELERNLSERARRDLVAAVSHDLRTPLSALTLVARALEDDVADEQTLRRYVGQMTINLESLNKLIDDLFEYTRMESGDVSWSLEALALNVLIEETVEGMTPIADASGIELQSAISEDLPRVRANAEKIQRVLFNLIQNAVQHTQRGGEVSVVGTAEDEDEVQVEVTDTGSGIPVDDVERVFEPLWRGDRHRSAGFGAGAGLGLPIARSIVEAHGGRISVVDTSPSGTRIRFTLPQVPAGVGAVGSERAATHTSNAAWGGGRGDAEPYGSVTDSAADR